MRALKDRVTVRVAVTNINAMASIDENPPPSVVLVVDDAVSSPYRRPSLWDRLDGYIRSGGTVIFMSHFIAYTDERAMNSIFNRLGTS
jgi:hypothetical protein